MAQVLGISLCLSKYPYPKSKGGLRKVWRHSGMEFKWVRIQKQVGFIKNNFYSPYLIKNNSVQRVIASLPVRLYKFTDI